MSDLLGLRASTAALLAGLADLTDADVRRPSLLPDWTVGHVLSHLARNADGLRGMVEAAVEGRSVPMYPSAEARAAGIETGADRSAAELVADVVAAAAALDAAWPAPGDPAWEGTGLTLRGPWPISDLPFRRWREVEVHRSDLGLAFGWEDWSDAYVERELAVMLAESAARTPDGHPVVVAPDDDPRQVLAWLLGRADPPPGHAPIGAWQ